MENEKEVEEQMGGDELVECWKDKNKAWCFEGDAGLDKLTKLIEALGYEGHGFKYGSPIEAFLSDNPGAQDAIVDFIGEWVGRNDDWRACLEDAVGIGAGHDKEDEDEG